jgi:hypothetical protein
MVFVEGDDYRQLRRPGDDPAQFRSVVRPAVRPAQVPVAPDSVVHQYRGENFTTSTWVDTAPSGPQADMSITGISASTLNSSRSASSDGVDDFAEAPSGPDLLPSSPSFGFTTVIQFNDADNNTDFNTLYTLNTKAASGQGFIVLVSQDGSNISLLLDDATESRLFVETTLSTTLGDGNAHLICINKTGDAPSDVNFYVDDMSTVKTQQTKQSGGFNSSKYNVPNVGNFFFAQQFKNDRFFDADTAFIEFNEEPYSQQDRLDLKQRAPGL